VPALRAILEAEYEIPAVITQPDRPQGRGLKISASPVKKEALKQGLPIHQPDNVNSADFIEELAKVEPQLLVSAGYGQKISSRILCLAGQGVWNIHPSLLPEFRGAAPVVWAILNGKEKTGVSIFRMAEEMDAGDIIAQEETDIVEGETAGELELRLAEIGARLVVRVLKELEAGEVSFTPQDESKVTFAPGLKKADGLINWKKSAPEVVNQVRAMNPWPGAYTYVMRSEGEGRSLNERLGIWRAVLSGKIDANLEKKPGRVLAAEEGGVTVSCGSGAVVLKEVQPAGKRRMSAADFIHGHRTSPGDRFG
jgi:methionyl-tRNA formyltransferase